MGTSLHVLRILALALWVGSIAFFAFGVAPVAFHVLPTTHEAGLVVSGSLHVLHAIGLTCGVLFLIAALVSMTTRTGVISRHRARPSEFPSPGEHPPVDQVAESRPDFGRAGEYRAANNQAEAGRVAGSRQLVRRRLVSVALVLLMSSLTAYSAFGILPRMERDRVAAGGEIDAVPTSTPTRMEFDRLHHTSEQVEGGVLLAGLLALILVAVDGGRVASAPFRG